MLTLAQIWEGGIRGLNGGESSAHSSCRRFGRRGVATPEGETDDEKKVPNIENEKKREAGKVPLLPFLIRSFHAAEAAEAAAAVFLARSRTTLKFFQPLFPVSLSPSFFVVAAKKNGASHALTSSSPDMRKMAQNQSLNLESIG